MALSLDTLVDRVIARLQDIARLYPNEKVGTGNGVATVFYLLYPPLKKDSQSVYIDGVLKTITTHYIIDEGLGKITFLTAPLAGTKITADYTGLYMAEDDIRNIVEVSVSDMALYYPDTNFIVDSGIISPAPAQAEEALLLLYALLNTVQAEWLKASRDSIRTARTGVSIDTSSRPSALERITEVLQKQLEDLVNKSTLRNTYLSDYEDLKF